MKRVVAILVAAGSLASAGAAQAQSWGVWFGTRPAYGGYAGYDRDGDGDGVWRAVCSGQRAHQLEGMLRHENGEDEIDPRTAGRMHAAIDRLEDQARDECGEGDRRGVWRIAQQYNRIQQWIDREAHGYRGW